MEEEEGCWVFGDAWWGEGIAVVDLAVRTVCVGFFDGCHF